MNERAIMALMRMLDFYKLDWPYHEKISFSRCALEEILQQVWDHPLILASEIIERFAERMEDYKASSETNDQRQIFSVSADTAWKILKEIQSLEKSPKKFF